MSKRKNKSKSLTEDQKENHHKENKQGDHHKKHHWFFFTKHNKSHNDIKDNDTSFSDNNKNPKEYVKSLKITKHKEHKEHKEQKKLQQSHDEVNKEIKDLKKIISKLTEKLENIEKNYTNSFDKKEVISDIKILNESCIKLRDLNCNNNLSIPEQPDVNKSNEIINEPQFNITNDENIREESKPCQNIVKHYVETLINNQDTNNDESSTHSEFFLDLIKQRREHITGKKQVEDSNKYTSFKNSQPGDGDLKTQLLKVMSSTSVLDNDDLTGIKNYVSTKKELLSDSIDNTVEEKEEKTPPKLPDRPTNMNTNFIDTKDQNIIELRQSNAQMQKKLEETNALVYKLLRGEDVSNSDVILYTLGDNHDQADQVNDG